MKRQTSLRGRVAAAALWALALALLAGPAALAQSGRSTVRGTVRDQQGNVVTGATVTLTDAGRNFTRTQTTNDEGGYTFTAVPPGTYRVEVEATGFKKAAVAEVQALVDTPVEVDVPLEAGLSTETVTVTGSIEAPLNTTDATIGAAFESRRIMQLPLNARNVVGLLSLQPGVTRDGYVNGARADQANVTLDGVDVNEQQRGLDVVTDEAFASRPALDARLAARVPRHDHQRERRPGPLLRRAGLARHQVGHQQLPRLALPLPPQHGDDRQRLLQQRGGRRAPAASAQHLRRLHRRPDQEGSHLLLRHLRGLPRGDRDLGAARGAAADPRPGHRALPHR